MTAEKPDRPAWPERLRNRIIEALHAPRARLTATGCGPCVDEADRLLAGAFDVRLEWGVDPANKTGAVLPMSNPDYANRRRVVLTGPWEPTDNLHPGTALRDEAVQAAEREAAERYRNGPAGPNPTDRERRRIEAVTSGEHVWDASPDDAAPDVARLQPGAATDGIGEPPPVREGEES